MYFEDDAQVIVNPTECVRIAIEASLIRREDRRDRGRES